MRITKKFFQESDQRNVRLNKDYYTPDSIDLLLATNTIDNPFSDEEYPYNVMDENWVVIFPLSRKLKLNLMNLVI